MKKKSLFDFTNEELKSKTSEQMQKFENLNQETRQNIMEKLKEYENKSQDEIMNELTKNIEEQKKKGLFDYSKLSSMLGNISPYISSEQNQNLKDLLEKFK